MEGQCIIIFCKRNVDYYVTFYIFNEAEKEKECMVHIAPQFSHRAPPRLLISIKNPSARIPHRGNLYSLTPKAYTIKENNISGP